MSDRFEGADQVGHGEASLGEAQASDAPNDPEMLRDDADAPEDEEPAADAP